MERLLFQSVRSKWKDWGLYGPTQNQLRMTWFQLFQISQWLQTGWLSITQRLLYFQWPDCPGLFTSSFHLPHVPVIWILILLILTTNNRIVTHNTENIKPVMVVHCFNLSTWKAEGASPVYCELQANQNNIRKTLFQNQTKPQMNKNTNNSKCILWFPQTCIYLLSFRKQ